MLGALCLLGSCMAPACAASAPAQPSLQEVRQGLIQQTNRFRAAHGLQPLREAPRLSRAAQGFADHMARTDRYGHEADGRTPAERAKAQGYDFCLVAENIAYQFSSAGFRADELAGRFEQGWETSPPHRANMLDADAVDIGVALAQSPTTRRYYAVQMFGRTLADGLQFELANTSRAPVSYRLDGQRYALPPHTTRTHRVCRPPKVELQESSRSASAKVLRPENGQRYVLAADP
jgi:uncharacterized protein YkwD